MRTLSSTFLLAQRLRNKPKLTKVVLSRTGQTTRGYNLSRILSVIHNESPSSYKADIVLRNSDKALVSLDFEHYQVVISNGYKTGISRTAWAANTAYAIDDVRIPTTANGYQYRCSIAGTSHADTEPTWPTDLGVTVTEAGSTLTWEMDGNTGDEYDRTAPLRVRAQELLSGRGVMQCTLRCIGIPDMLNEDKAIAKYTQTDADTNTVKTLITAICTAGAGLSGAYNGYTAITVVYDSEDSLIDTYVPKDYFSISVNDSRWAKIEELLSYTKCKARIGNDGKLHILVPTTTGINYSYEYKWNVAGDHTFLNKTVRNRFVNPNKEIVRTPTSYTTQYTGNATSATSFALDPKVRTTYRRIISDAQGAAIAAALIEQNELDAERGIAVVPMNAGQELWDYVKVTDSKQGDTRIGNVQYLSRSVPLPEGDKRVSFPLLISFGKVATESLLAYGLGSETGAPDWTSVINDITRFLFNYFYTKRDLDLILDELLTISSGYPKKLQLTGARYVRPGWHGDWDSTNPVANRVYYMPIFVSESTLYTKIGIEVTTLAADATVGLAIYTWENGLPTSRILDAGTVSVATTGIKTIAISQTLERGYYFLACRCTSATAVIRGLSWLTTSPPVQGFTDVAGGDTEPHFALLYVDGTLDDPAAAPTGGTEVVYAFVFLEENG